MAREIILGSTDYAGSNPLYFVAYLVADDRYVNGTSLETYDATHWPQYAITLTQDATTGDYYGDIPAVASGSYMVKIWEQLGSSPDRATDTAVDPVAEGEFVWNTSTFVGSYATDFNSQLIPDGGAFINEFAEEIVYVPEDDAYGGGGSMMAVVVRDLPTAVNEDGHTLTASTVVYIRNDEDTGRLYVTPKRDKIIVSDRFGGPSKELLVVEVLPSDEGIWALRVR